MRKPIDAPHYDPYLDIKAIAAYTSYHPDTIRDEVRSRGMAASKMGKLGHYRVRLSEVNRWMMSRERKAGSG